MKRVLIISYYWPPAGGSGVQRWVKFSKFLPQEGWQPVVYTPLNPEISSVDNTLAKDIPAEAEIIKRSIVEPYGIYRKLFGSKSSTDMKTLSGEAGAAKATGGEVNPISGGKKSIKQTLPLWIRGNLFIPDPRVWWVRPSVRYLKEYLREHPVDAIVTSGPPHSMHMIGRGLHRATGIPWVADFRDPWTKMFYYKHLHLTKASDKRHHRMEKSVLNEADAIIAVSPLVQRDFQSETTTPVMLITNGYDADDFTSRDDAARTSFTSFNVTHTGLFAEDGNPLVLWDALASKCAEDKEFGSALRIRLAGKVDSAIIASLKERGLGNKLDLLGYVSHDEAVKEQQGASLLILPLRQEPEYRSVLPGKIFEYLAAGKPILGIGQEDGAAAGILEDTHTGWMCDWDNIADVRKAIDCSWDIWNGICPFAHENISRYSRSHLTRTLSALLNQVSKQTT